MGFTTRCHGVWRREVVLTVEEVAELVARLELAEERAQGLPRSIQEALNSGDGTYKP